ncbi:MAG: SprT family zinc-dependent metalloprotease [Chloroflexota bacterium]
MIYSVQYGDATIEYRLSFAPRKTLAIEVHPDLRVTVRAPAGSDLDTIQQKVKKRVPWILRQQRRFESYLPKLPPRQYVSGETHRYLGRQYRLKVSESDTDSEAVRLSRGYFFITVRDKTDAGRVKTLLAGWYRRQAERVFRERLDACLTKLRFLQLAEPELEIRQMDARWGSCTPEGKILLNLRLMQAPKEYIDYVIMHELCHLKEHNHSRRFYELLNRVMPDWRTKREQLNEMEVS